MSARDRIRAVAETLREPRSVNWISEQADAAWSTTNEELQALVDQGQLRRVEAGETVGERHTVRGDPDRIDALLDHLRDQSLTVEVVDDYREDGERVVEFVKVAESTTDRIRYYLEGGTRDEGQTPVTAPRTR